MHVKRLIAMAALTAALTQPAFADHPGSENLDKEMLERETYFQPAEKAPAPGFELVNAAGDPVALADLQGKVVVLNFIFANCTDFCPVHSQKIAELQEAVNASPMGERVEFVSITTDPASDTPDVLSGYAELHGLDPSNWRFLTVGPDMEEDATRALASAYGVDFMKMDDSEMMMHGVVTFVIDPEGRLAARFHGLEFDVVNAVLYINGLIDAAQHAQGHASEEPGFFSGLTRLFK